MDVSNDLLLHRLVDSPGSQDGIHADFKTAMQRMGLESVFDIVRMTKEQFTRELARHSDADAQQAYDNAVSYARQISRLYQEHQVSSGDAKRRVRRSPGSDSTTEPATYQALFNENWEQFCKDGDIAAIDSPVAYLRALYLFAGQLEKSSSEADKITLEKRRPDLKALMLDQQSAFAARPMLSIVNDTLNSHIQQHLTKTNATKTVHEMLASEHYPFSLPYDLHHQQCLLGLGADKPALGELNYRVSLKLPFSQGGTGYGHVSNAPVEAQKLLSGLSPEQQRILIVSPVTDADLKALEKAYGTKSINRLHELEFFKERTGLATEQVEQVLSQGKYSPRTSTNSPPFPQLRYGAGYINGLETGDDLNIVAPQKNAANDTQRVISGGSEKRSARLHRMLRLHRWTGIPLVELDILIVNTGQSEDTRTLELNTNTLRTLGVYRYLNKRYGIPAEEFASLLHNIPTSACGDRVPLFDQVFHRTQLLASPLLQKQGQDLDIEAVDSQPTLSYLSAGLGLPVTQDSLLLLAKQTKEHLSSLKHDLPTVSSLYRQARIARMLGLSPVECTELARLLGGDTFCKLLVTGTIRNPEATESDILDVLMAMDWAVDWFKHSNRDVEQLRRLFDTAKNDLPRIQDLQKRLRALQADDNPTDDQKTRQVEILLHDIADLSAEYVPSVMKLAGTSVTAVYADIRNLTPGEIPPSLAKMLLAAKACQGLHLSSRTLQVLMRNPKCLASNSSGALTPQTLYLLERFSHCARHQAQSEENLLHYLRLANTTQQPVEEANGLLANLLNWTIEEVSCLTAQLEKKHARTMEEVDWVIRCQACCEGTGLSARLLLKATSLTANSSTSDWKAVGEALIAARH
ncbi:Tc toxin subunit A [Pseudomonas sp. H3(2019)]|uniref:Tc toxin subunit A n=1 Tax=Pseudomonas sp. H3(2019) TaxID=2598724 RepID=UPI00118F83F2|nr:Tc toxin subunit A [Pseudomonas sp. H3(2019)]TVT84561.1 toxin [Pseudomonas sp. H3(2019)]